MSYFKSHSQCLCPFKSKWPIGALQAYVNCAGSEEAFTMHMSQEPESHITMAIYQFAER